jgi:hypothetical protein
MKMYLYYATEENCYETEKHVSENPIEDVKQFLKDDGLSDDGHDAVDRSASALCEPAEQYSRQ